VHAKRTATDYTGWEHEDLLETMQRRLDLAPDSMRIRWQTVEHPFSTIKAWMVASHFLTRTLKNVSTEDKSAGSGLQHGKSDDADGNHGTDGSHDGLMG
jgi:hypothetical protein